MNNHFEVDVDDPESRKAIFSISDFIGYACRNVGKCMQIDNFWFFARIRRSIFVISHRTIVRWTTINMFVYSHFAASRIRGMVAQTPFDQFHRYSNSIIRKAVFGVDKDDKVNKMLKFDANQLVSASQWFKFFNASGRNSWGLARTREPSEPCSEHVGPLTGWSETNKDKTMFYISCQHSAVIFSGDNSNWCSKYRTCWREYEKQLDEICANGYWNIHHVSSSTLLPVWFTKRGVLREVCPPRLVLLRFFGSKSEGFSPGTRFFSHTKYW